MYRRPEWYDLDCVYAVADTKDAGRRQEYDGRAVELLRKAVAAGWDDAAFLKEDDDLHPFHGRDDFEKKFPARKAPAVPEKE